MPNTNQQWVLFGFDVRKIGYYFRAGWHDFFWGEGSSALAAVDEPVRLRTPASEERYFRAGKPSSGASTDGSCEAVLLPDSLVLLKTLKVPLAAEPELESVLAIEVSTGSPFAADDTSFGWRVLGRSDVRLDVALAISSRSAVMAHIAQQHGSHDTHAYEVWADAGADHVQEQFIVLSGFGEEARRQRNSARLKRVGALAAYCAVALVVFFAVAAGSKYLELQRAESIGADVEARATEAMRKREQLADSKALISAAQELTDSLPPPYVEFKRLTQILDDGTWLKSAELRGGKVKIEGESINAAAVMQLLLDNPAYTSVESPVAFKKMRSGKERFVFNLVRSKVGSTAQ
ncbi:MAG: PilN domain-containing protein [Halioglobus sp.]